MTLSQKILHRGRPNWEGPSSRWSYQKVARFNFLNVEPVAVAEWRAHMLTVWEVSRSNPGILPLLHACRECDQLPCWPSRGPKVLHQRWISRIHCMQVTKHASEGSTVALKPRGDVTRSPKQGYQRFHKKYSCLPKKEKPKCWAHYLFWIIW